MGDGHDDQVHETAVRRRGVIAGAVAMAVGAMALDRPDTALAHDPQDVLLGGPNSAASTTSITCTENSSTALSLHADTGVYSFGLRATGTAYGVYATGGAYAGVFGDTSTSGSAGVTGLARSTAGGYGVSGGNSSKNGAGVIGSSPGVGVWGQSFGDAPSGSVDAPSAPVGVYGAAPYPEGIGAMFLGGRAPVRLVPAATPGAPAAGVHEAGELSVSSDGKLFFCAAPGTPGTWIELGVQPTPAAQVPKRSTLVLLPTPERFVDTRIGLGGVKGQIAARNTLTFVMTGRDGQAANPALRIPDNATAIVGNLTAVGGASAVPGAFLTLWPGGDQPTVSNLNYGPGQTIANSYVVGLAPQNGHGTVKVFNQSDCDYILDVSGYYIDI